MGSSTRCCASRTADARGLRAAARRAVLALLVLALWLPAQRASWAQQGERMELQAERTSDGVFLSATLALHLPEAVQDALRKGIAMHFVAQAQVLRHRWYWSDKVQAQAVRYQRLSYQPLTRRWRLAQSPEPIATSGLGVVLGQTFDELEEALAAMQRISRWQITEPGMLDDDTPYTVRLHYRLDTSQLPRPLQWGAVGGANWSLQLEGSVALPVVPPSVPEPVPEAAS